MTFLSIPFTLHLDKSNELPFFGLRFARFSPQELSLGLPWCRDKKQPPVPDGFREKLENKVKKLAPYKVRGKTTVLLIESIDIAFMNDRIMLKWLKEAYSNGLPDKVDRIWYAARFNSEFIFKDFTVHIASDSSMMQIDMQGY